MNLLVRLAERKTLHLLVVQKTLRLLVERKTPHLLAELRTSKFEGHAFRKKLRKVYFLIINGASKTTLLR